MAWQFLPNVLTINPFLVCTLIMNRGKPLVLDINYSGSENELRCCHQDVNSVAKFLSLRAYSDDPRSQVILRDNMDEQ